MTEEVRKELKKNLNMINCGFENVILTDDIPKDIVKMQFESIRVLIDYCESLVRDGETAIEEWQKDFREKGMK